MQAQYVFISQATSRVMFELAVEVSKELGTTLVLTGNDCPLAPEPRLTIWKGPGYNNASYRSRMQAWLAFSAWTLAKSRQIEGTPVVLVSSNPPFLPMVSALIKKHRGWPFVTRVLDVYPDALAKHGLTKQEHPIYQAWAVANRLAYAHADAVVTLAPKMGRSVAEYLASGREPLLIPDWVDPTKVFPIPKADNWFARKHGLSDKFVLAYSGNLGASHDISGLISAAEQLRDNSKILFLFIGGGSRASELRALADRLPNCRALPFQAEADISYAMAAADVGLVALGTSSAAVSMPSKSYYLMSAGCALLGLTTDDDDVRDLIDTYQCGLYAHAGDSKAIKAAILRLSSDTEFLHRSQRNARAAAELHYSTRVCTRKYLDLLAGIHKQRQAAQHRSEYIEENT